MLIARPRYSAWITNHAAVLAPLFLESFADRRSLEPRVDFLRDGKDYSVFGPANPMDRKAGMIFPSLYCPDTPPQVGRDLFP